MAITKVKEMVMNDNVFIVCITVAVISLISAVTFYNYEQLKSVQSNVESAIVKGIDPVAVRCAYARESDVVCVAYGATHPRSPSPAK
jgi:hypothetical protein